MKTKLVSLPFSKLAALIAVGAFALTGSANADDSKLTSKDKSFITDASEGGTAEVQSAELANKKSTNAEVKQFAEMMIKDHTKANKELEKIVTGKGGEVSKSPSATQKANYLLLEARSGDSFDKAYAEQALKDHKETVALFEKAANDLDDPELKAFAKKTLPTLKMHLEHAEKLAGKFGK